MSMCGSSVYSRIAILMGGLANLEGEILCLRYNLLHAQHFIGCMHVSTD